MDQLKKSARRESYLDFTSVTLLKEHESFNRGVEIESSLDIFLVECFSCGGFVRISAAKFSASKARYRRHHGR
jgi:hypothetical protein